MQEASQHTGSSGSWTQSLNAYRRTDLAGIAKVQLLKRSDSKYVFAIRHLPELLERLKDAYLALDPGRGPLVAYDNRYFDTVDFRCYRDHHNGRGTRHKFRYRRYGNSGLTHFEVKTKNNRGKTDKWQTTIPEARAVLPSSVPQAPELGAQDRIARSGFDPALLHPCLDIGFDRFTLVDRGFRDRCTVDTMLRLSRPVLGAAEAAQQAGAWSTWPELAIAEVKQERFSRDCAFVAAMEAMGIRPLRISKYCLGMLETRPGLRYHRFKAKYRNLCQLADRPLPESYPFSPAQYAQHQAIAS